jgi:superfamily II DNA/RNA helicase
MTDLAFELASTPGFRNELAQIGARSALALLGSQETPRWRYRADRVVRNLTALGQSLLQVASDGDEGISAQRAAALLTAQGWESLAVLEEHVTRTEALLNSALFYELAGYQANATCLARVAVDRRRWTTDPSFNGLLSAFLQRLFLRATTLKRSLTAVPDAEDISTEDELQRRASQAVTALGIEDAAFYFLTGDARRIDSARLRFGLAKRGFTEAGDAIGYNAVTSLDQTLPLMVSRSTWQLLGDASDNPRWQRYLKVLARGLGPDLLEARSISELWPSQRAAVDGGLLRDDHSLAIRMPTSAGKTRVAELAIVHTLVTRPGARCVYIAPYKALATEIEDAFANLFTDLGYGASTIPGGYDQDEMSAELAALDDVMVLTPEKLDLLFRLRAEMLDEVALIVIDEGHIVGDRQRGPKFELLVSRLRRRVPNARFLMMSAVVPDETLEDFALWLGGNRDRSVTTDWRPSLLRYGRLDWDGTRGTLRLADDDVVEGGLEFIPDLVRQAEYPHVFPATGRVRRPKFPKSGSKGDVAAEVAYKFASLGPVLIFTMQTDWSESIASALLRRVQLAELTQEHVPDVFALRDEGRAIAVAQEWLGETHVVTQLLRHGIAFHHGRLPDAVRGAIEYDFRDRNLAVLVATTTLAQGVNLPVRTVVIHGCRSQDEDGNPRVLSPREYWNIAGRAGRAGAETEGTVIHIASTPYDMQDFDRYAASRREVDPVESALHRMLRDLVDGRTSSTEAAAQLDPDLLALLVEEDDIAVDEATLAETLASSLFRIQAAETDTAIDPLITVMTDTARRIRTSVPDVAIRRLYASTGLSSASCGVIADHARSALTVVENLVSGDASPDREELLDLLLAGLAEVREMEPRAAVRLDSRDLLSSWIDGESVRDVANRAGLDPQDLTEYIEDAFSYRLPWGISAYLRIATHVSGLSTLNVVASNIAGMAKYGVATPEAVWAMTAGVASRRAAIVVAQEYARTIRTRSAASFRRWLGRLNPDYVAERFGLTAAELESTARAILRSQPNDYLQRLDAGEPLLPLRVTCRLQRRALEMGYAYDVQVGQVLQVTRDLDSRLNRNSMYVSLNRHQLAYFPADAARALAPEIDAGLAVGARVTSVESENDRPSAVDLEVFEADAS